MMGVVKVEEKEEVATLIVQGTTDEKETSNLANTKEKTPMCLINELARFNKVSCFLLSLIGLCSCASRWRNLPQIL